jgi:hypothetical protein
MRRLEVNGLSHLRPPTVLDSLRVPADVYQIALGTPLDPQSYLESIRLG